MQCKDENTEDFFDREAPQTHRVGNTAPFKSPCLLNGQ